MDLKTAAWECGCCGEEKTAEHYIRVSGQELHWAVERLILQRGAWRTCVQFLQVPNEKDMIWCSICKEQLPRMCFDLEAYKAIEQTHDIGTETRDARNARGSLRNLDVTRSSARPAT